MGRSWEISDDRGQKHGASGVGAFLEGAFYSEWAKIRKDSTEPDCVTRDTDTMWQCTPVIPALPPCTG